MDEFRSISQQLVQAHYRSAYDEGEVGRVEVLPVSWWGALHSDESGIDQKLKSITLESIPKLRNFTNETLLDVLFYTSPVFSQVSCIMHFLLTELIQFFHCRISLTLWPTHLIKNMQCS